MKLYTRELRANLKALIFWSLCFIFLLVAGMTKFSGMAAGSDVIGAVSPLLEITKDMPASLKAVLGIGDFDLTKAMGFFGVLFQYFSIMAAIHAGMLGAEIISKEERDRTAEFLMVKPVSRNYILLRKTLAALTNVVLLNGILWLVSLYSLNYYGKNEPVARDLTPLMLGLFLLQLVFLSIGICLASVLKRSKAAAGICTGIILTAFMLNVVIQINEEMGFLQYITPFSYFSAAKILSGTGFEVVFVGISLLIVCGMSLLTFTRYQKRDLKI